MTKQEFSEHGLTVILPDEVAFASGLTALGFSASPEPTAVIVKNTSPHNVAALAVEFIATTADGSSLSVGSYAYYSPATMLDAGKPSRPAQAPVLGLYPGSSILLGAGGPLVTTGRNAPISHFAQPRSPVVAMQIKIDSVAFDNGDFWGPDNRHVAKKLSEHIRAQQDLMEEITARLGSSPANFTS